MKPKRETHDDDIVEPPNDATRNIFSYRKQRTTILWFSTSSELLRFLIALSSLFGASYGSWIIGREYATMRHEHRTIIPEMVTQESTSLRKFSRNHQEPRMTKILSSSFVHKERAPRSIGSLASVSTLLHPALLAHRNPRRVVIITTAIPSEACDGDAALYIQEALKHNAIEKIYVILVGVDNRKGFKGCLSMENRRVGSYWISLDDFELGAVHKILRVAMKAQGDNADMGEVVEGYDIDGIEKSPISILFVDASITSRLSPDVVVSWYNKLLPPKGKSHHSHPMMIVELVGPDSSSFTARYRYALAERLASDPEKSVTAKMTDFEAVLSTGSGDVRNYVTVFQALSTEAYWHRNEAEWSLTMREKLQADSRGGEHIFEYLDSAMMSLFEYPSKHSEVEYCRRNPTYDACKIGGSGFDPQKPNIKLDQLTVRKSLQGENAGRGVFTLVDIRKQSYIGAENRDFVLCRWKCNKIILDFADETDQEVEKISYVNRHKSLYSYFHGYGYADNTWGRADYVGDVLLLMFVNHGCNGTFNINHISEYHESSMEYPSDDLMLKASGSGSLSEQERLYLWEQIPADYRNVASTLYLPIRNRLAYRASTSEIDIPSGAELLDNYMTYGGLQGRTFWLNAKSLWEECRGMFGLIEQYQKPANRDEEKDASDTHICAEESVCPNQFRAGEYISATIT